MKLGKEIASFGVLLILIGLSMSNIYTYRVSTDLSNSLVINDIEEINIVDLSDLAINVDNVIEKEDISGIAMNITREEVYDHMTLNELGNKLNKSLKGTLKNKGYLVASESLKYGLDPYMVTAIMLHETGCNWRCSTLASKYYNFGGLKGGSGYMHFSSVDNGIKSYIEILYKNYYKKGWKTPEAIGPHYAGSKTWAKQVNAYIKAIRNK